LRDVHTDAKKGVYHLNDIKLFVVREEHLANPNFNKSTTIPVNNNKVKELLKAEAKR